jgi:hypothetical protein
VKHKDLNADILMQDKLNNNRGVLTDYDLAQQPNGDQWMGFSLLFKATDLLYAREDRGNSEPLYRHDCESFAWILLWIQTLFDGAYVRTCSGYCGQRHCLVQKPANLPYPKFWPAVSAFASWCGPSENSLKDGKTVDEIVGELQILLADQGFPMEL